MEELTRYVDIHAAACSGVLDDVIPLMSVETFPCATGGIRSALDDATNLAQLYGAGVDDSYSDQGVLAFWTGHKVRTVCLPARSTFILPISLWSV